ncbi:hypothetical protein NPIL_121751 [Nephila pilipes]|uniref:Uncharacterized protein n=1 Tax=Nephila pilipes TaxID=299642 RepID=A0A8X6PTW7_NEPPI|nr:hypothetical protein NPIL_121751 [Nephila pilipes]
METTKKRTRLSHCVVDGKACYCYQCWEDDPEIGTFWFCLSQDPDLKRSEPVEQASTKASPTTLLSVLYSSRRKTWTKSRDYSVVQARCLDLTFHGN